MALGRAYKIGVFDTATWLATGATVTTTATTPILFISTSANSDINISAVRCGVLGAAAFPSNASVVFSINTVTGTKAGGNAATPLQLSGIAKASLLTAVSTAGGPAPAAVTRPAPPTPWWSGPPAVTPAAQLG